MHGLAKIRVIREEAKAGKGFLIMPESAVRILSFQVPFNISRDIFAGEEAGFQGRLDFESAPFSDIFLNFENAILKPIPPEFVIKPFIFPAKDAQFLVHEVQPEGQSPGSQGSGILSGQRRQHNDEY